MSPPAQEVSFSRLLLVVTGSIGAAYLPAWLIWLSRKHPELELRVVLTRSAERFVTRTTVHASSGAPVEPDTWDDEDTAEARHVRWAQWADAVMVYPASMHYLARLAGGLADTPSLLAAHCTRAPVLVAPGLPPGAVEGPVYAQHVRALQARGNVDVIAPIMGVSVTTGQQDVAASAWFPKAVGRLEEMYLAQRGEQVGDDAPGAGAEAAREPIADTPAASESPA